MKNTDSQQSRKKRSPFKKIGIFAGALVVVLLGLFVAVSLKLQAPLSSAEAIADLDSLVVYIERVHPDPYWKIQRADFYRAVDQARQRFSKDDISKLEFSNEISRLAAMFHEGHLSVYSDVPMITKDMKMFPYFGLFELEPGSHRLTMRSDAMIQDAKFKAGDELLSINDRPCREIVDGALEMISGESDGFRCASLEASLCDVMNGINSWMNEKMPADSYRVKMKTSMGVKTVDVKSIGIIRSLFAATANSNNLKRDPFSYKMLNDSTMLFSFNECVTDNLNEFLKGMFARAKADGVRHLIIDNRYNGGGNSEAGDELCKYLTSNPFAIVEKMVIHISEPVRQRDINCDYPHDTTIVVELKPEDYVQPYSDNERFNGKVYLLNSRLTFSAAADFASQFSYFKMGTMIGEETGGTTISSGDVVTLRLPNSGMIVRLPFKLFYNVGADENEPVHGVMPDVETDSESALEAALKLIQNGE